MIKFHREGKNILVIISIIILLLSVGAFFLLPLLPYLSTQFLLLVFAFMIFRFFRVPNRQMTSDINLVIAPADGKVVAIETVEDTEYFKDTRIQVSIFMSIHNVHINWYPIPGEVTYYKYHPGKYLLARHPKSSSLNEHSSTVIKKGMTEILVKQIAGYVARRIICNSEQGKMVESGEELGFIKFGSRLDLLLPAGTKLLVGLGDKTKGGITEIASLL
jgi:phosphatidylserine decarboxylase